MSQSAALPHLISWLPPPAAVTCSPSPIKPVHMQLHSLFARMSLLSRPTLQLFFPVCLPGIDPTCLRPLLHIHQQPFVPDYEFACLFPAARLPVAGWLLFLLSQETQFASVSSEFVLFPFHCTCGRACCELLDYYWPTGPKHFLPSPLVLW